MPSQNKPKILFVMHMPPPVHGAAMVGQYIHDSELIRNSFDCHYMNLAVAKSLEDVNKGGVRKLFAILGKYIKAWRMAKAISPDLVYITPNTSGLPFYKDFVMVQMIKHLGCKVIAHFHNKGISANQDKWLDNKLYQRYFKGMKLILLSESLYGDVSRYIERENVYFCPNGIPDIANVNKTRSADTVATRLLFLSNLIVEKGVIVLLDALKLLKDRKCSVVCDFVGGDTREIDATRFGREVILRGLEGVAIYHGKKYGVEKEEFLSKADIMVFPTYYPNECFPLVLLEGMAASLPCISTREGAIPDIVEDGITGLLIDRKDPRSLADAIEELVADPGLRESMGKAGKNRFLSEFTIESFENKMCTILKDACSKP